MTHDELIKNGWIPRNCRVGTLYFKGDFFGSLKDGVFELRGVMDDMTPIGNAMTFDDIRHIQQQYYRLYIDVCEQQLKNVKKKLAALSA